MIQKINKNKSRGLHVFTLCVVTCMPDFTLISVFKFLLTSSYKLYIPAVEFLQLLNFDRLVVLKLNSTTRVGI